MEVRREAFDKLRAEDPDARYALVQGLLGQVAALSARVQELEARVGQHSQNSHRPPSSAVRPVPTRSQRTAQGKRPGGQPGHRGQTLAMRATPDAVVAHHPHACGHCGEDLTAVPPRAAERRQVVDLPPLALVVTEHRAATVCCPRCHQATTAPFPAGVQPGVQYGPQVLGLGLYLRHYQLLPYLRIQEPLTDLFGASPGVGTLHTAGQRAASALVPVEAARKAALAAAGLLHADETGLRVQGQGVWVHVASTARLTHDAWHAKRGQAATDAIAILPHFRGRLIHDAWAPYWHLPCQHSLGNAHLLRDLTAVAEQPGQRWATAMRTLLRDLTAVAEQPGQRWATAMRTLLRALYRTVTTGRTAGLTACPPARLATFLRRYQRLRTLGEAANPPPQRQAGGPQRGRLKQRKARNLLDRLRRHADAVLAFLHDWTVPFDNNQAERDLRMRKVQQQISGTFRDPASADAFCRLRSSIATRRKQGQALLTALTLTLRGQPPLPALAPE